MRTLDSLEKEEARLRKKHTAQALANQWELAQTTREKLMRVLNQIREFKDEHFKPVEKLKEHMPPNILSNPSSMAIWARGYNEGRFADRKKSDCPYTSRYAVNWEQGWQRAEAEMFLERTQK